MVQANASTSSSDRFAQLQQSRALVRRGTMTKNPSRSSTDAESRRKAVLSSKQTYTTVRGQRLADIPNQTSRSPLSQEQQEEQESNQSQQRQQYLASTTMARTTSRRSSLARQQEEGQEEMEKKNQEEKKRKQNGSMLNGFLMVGDTLTTGLDAGMMGTSFIFTLIV